MSPTTSIPVFRVSGAIAVIPNLQLGIVAGTNRTGRFPASGSRTKLHAVTFSTSCPSRLKRSLVAIVVERYKANPRMESEIPSAVMFVEPCDLCRSTLSFLPKNGAFVHER
jgi:hypothetical protein